MAQSLFDVWLLDALALTSAVIGVRWDLRTLRVPNWLTGGTAALAVALWLIVWSVHPSEGGGRFLLALLGALSVLLCFGGLSCFELLGFGDTKLAAAIGLCIGYPASLRLIVCTLVCGGAVALMQAARAGHGAMLLATLRRPRSLAALRIQQPAHAVHAMPYALAIALGTAWAIAARYWPEVAPL